MAKVVELAQDLFKIRPEELRRTVLAFVYLLASVGAFVTGRITRSVLFLEIPNYKDQLPLVYLGIAVFVSAAMYGYARFERRLRRDHTNIITLVGLIVVNLGFRWLLREPSHAVYWAFYIWVEIYGTFLIVQFWSFANEIFHSRQAKRLFAFVGGGGIVGNIVFSGVMQVTVKEVGTENMLFLLCLCLGIALAAVVALGRAAHGELIAAWQRKPPAKAKGAKGAAAQARGQRVFATRHVQLIAAVVMLTYLVSYLVDYQFQVIVGDEIAGKEERGAYFASFFLYTGLIGGFVQFFVTARLLERFGVLPALLMLPLSMFGGSVLLLVPVLSGLWSVAVAKGAEGVLRYTVNDSTLQLMYLPVPAHIRGRAKAFIDGILKPVSIGGSGLILAVLVGQLEKLTGWPLGLSVSVYDLSWLVAGAILAWLGALLLLRREYLRSLMDTLQRRRLNFAEARFEISDDATIKTLEKALGSPVMGEVLHSLELLPYVSKKARSGLMARVAQLLTHSADEVRVAALGFLGHPANLQIGGVELRVDQIAALLDDPSPKVRAAATLAYCAHVKDKALDRTIVALDDADQRVRAHAVAGLIRYGGLDGILACADRLKKMLRGSDPEREHAAWILGEIGLQNFYQPLLPLLDDSAERVRLSAIDAAGKLKHPELIPALVSQLERSHLAGAAVSALVNYGPLVEETVSGVLSSTTRPPTVRAQACRVLARLADNQGVRILCEHLEDPHPKVRSAVAQALATIVHRNPGAPLDDQAIHKALRAEGEGYFGMVALAQDLALDGKAVLLEDAIAHRTELRVRQALALLGLKYPQATIDLVTRNLQSSQAATKANAVEVLDNLLSKDEKAIVIPMLDDAPADKKLEAGTELFRITRSSRNERLLALLHCDDTWLQVCAATAVADWGIKDKDLESRVAALLDSPTPLCRETAIVVLRRLSKGSKGTSLKKMLGRLKEDPARSVSRYVHHVLAELR